jgi:hypothetical protein
MAVALALTICFSVVVVYVERDRMPPEHQLASSFD